MKRLLLLLAVAGCARYEPAPLEPARHPDAWAARTLAGDSAWSVPALAVATWRLRPELEAARRRWEAVRAAEITAGRRPPPGVAGGVEYGRDPGPFEEPWSIGVQAILRFELGGKRGARIAAAEGRTLEAELAARALAHQLASDTREAALAVALADSAVAANEARRRAVEERIRQLRQLYEQGTLGRGTLDEATAALRLAERDVAAARGGAARARAELAQRLGVPVRVTDALRVSLDQVTGCAWLDRLDATTLRSLALRRRFEVGQALAAYAAAEGDLRLAVAEQYPDLELSPGFMWDQGLARWMANVALPTLLLDRNRGPIAEATAWRAQRASEVEVAQQAVLAEVESAVTVCRATAGERAAAAELVAATEARARTVRAAFERGETGRQDLFALAQSLADALAARLEADASRVLAGARLERAAGLWAADSAYALPDPLGPRASTDTGATR